MAESCLVLIGIGANLPGPDGQPPLETCRQAIAMLDSYQPQTTSADCFAQSDSLSASSASRPLATSSAGQLTADADGPKRHPAVSAGMRLVAVSRWFESAPVPPTGQPPYVNAVAALRVDPGGAIDPALLLAYLMRLEVAHGRRRSTPNAARTLDLDIIAIGDLVRDAPDPILPHPRAHLRAFVLAPLIDVAPTWVHPVLQRNAAALLAALPPQEIRPLRT